MLQVVELKKLGISITPQIGYIQTMHEQVWQIFLHRTVKINIIENNL